MQKKKQTEVQPCRVISQMTTLFTAPVRVSDGAWPIVVVAVAVVDASHISLIDLSIAIKWNST